MSAVQHVQQDKNPLAASFLLVGQDIMGIYDKILVTQKDSLVKHLPIAQYFFQFESEKKGIFSAKTMLFNGFDLNHTSDGTLITINKSATITRENKDTSWTDDNLTTAREALEEKVAEGGVLVDLHGLSTLEAEEPYWSSNEKLMEAADIFNGIAREKALKHYGDCILYDLKANGNTLTPVLDLLGSCMGCGLQNMTYGKTPEEASKKLAEQGNPYTIQKVEFKPRNKNGVLYLR